MSKTPLASSSRTEQDFEILHYLGSGAFGEVYKVRNRIDGQLYAIKRIRIDAQRRDKILREARVLSALNHARITRYYNCWIEQIEEELKPAAAVGRLAGDGHGHDSLLQSLSLAGPLAGRLRLYSDAVAPPQAPLQNAGTVEGQSTETPTAPPAAAAAAVSASTPALICNICTKAYLDWAVAFTDWGKLDASLQPLNLCTDCYQLALTKMGFDLSRVQIIVKSKAGGAGASSSSASAAATPKRTQPTITVSYLFIQTEYCDATLLETCTSSGAETPSQAASSSSLAMEQIFQVDKQLSARRWQLFWEVCEGLAYLHTSGVVHRDLKPSNIFVKDGSAKIGDLGLATYNSAGGSSDGGSCGSAAVGDGHGAPVPPQSATDGSSGTAGNGTATEATTTTSSSSGSSGQKRSRQQSEEEGAAEANADVAGRREHRIHNHVHHCPQQQQHDVRLDAGDVDAVGRQRALAVTSASGWASLDGRPLDASIIASSWSFATGGGGGGFTFDRDQDVAAAGHEGPGGAGAVVRRSPPTPRNNHVHAQPGGHHHHLPSRGVGTWLYMGPECMSGQYSDKSDMYSLGVVLYELWSPFASQHERVRMLDALKRGAVPRSFVDAFPVQAQLISNLMQHDASKRPSASDLLRYRYFVWQQQPQAALASGPSRSPAGGSSAGYSEPSSAIVASAHQQQQPPHPVSPRKASAYLHMDVRQPHDPEATAAGSGIQAANPIIDAVAAGLARNPAPTAVASLQASPHVQPQHHHHHDTEHQQQRAHLHHHLDPSAVHPNDAPALRQLLSAAMQTIQEQSGVIAELRRQLHAYQQQQQPLHAMQQYSYR